MGGYTSHEVTGSTYLGTMYDEIKLDGLKFGDASPGVIGRFFVEVRLLNVIGLFASVLLVWNF